MSTYLIVKVPEAIIVNHHVGGQNDTWQPPEGHIEVMIPDGVHFDIGWHWNGKEPVDPSPPPSEHHDHHKRKRKGHMNEIG